MGRHGRSGWLWGITVTMGLTAALWAQDSPGSETPPADARTPSGAERPRAEAGVVRENTRLVDREGRILCLMCDLNVGSIHRSVFVPRDGLGYYILLENKFVEKVEDQTRHGEIEVKVSGTVTEYRGQNFLLLTRVFVPRE